MLHILTYVQVFLYKFPVASVATIVHRINFKLKRREHGATETAARISRQILPNETLN
jgi:hypothetical protein